MPPSPDSIRRWALSVQQHFPCLSRPQAWVLALWSFGAQALQYCGQSQVSFFLARVLEQKNDTLRQRLREWTWEREAKAGRQRREVVVAPCFACLLSWVVSAWAPGEQRLALALDATTLGQRFVVLAVSVLYRGCAIPIAWQVLPATAPGTWQPHWLALLTQVRGWLPADWRVLVLADRGLFAPWLFRAIQHAGWHPFLRINSGGKCRPAGASEFRPLLSLLRPGLPQWCGPIVCFKGAQLRATLLVAADEQHAEPWLILTDLTPEAAEVSWYSLRAWIEAGFKDTKGGGWQWQRTRMTDPERASRLWLVLAVALLYSAQVGSQAEAQTPASGLAELPPNHIARRTATGRPQPRRLSLISQGRLRFLADLICGRPLPAPSHFAPNPWPTRDKTYP